ncbi:hypothetical protein BCR42DRAFT_386580 [Absidia repens]|uniref:Uncharacterized protein n=1 Tax=Absidia repens TaxID=90262 RepID=A0A1X2J2G4_9FUNG|nr:hypothetical protein BCR42DRAFT_386580 [Absidia repens]
MTGYFIVAGYNVGLVVWFVLCISGETGSGDDWGHLCIFSISVYKALKKEISIFVFHPSPKKEQYRRERELRFVTHISWYEWAYPRERDKILLIHALFNRTKPTPHGSCHYTISLF